MKFKRSIAAILAFLCLFSLGSISATAEGIDPDLSGMTLDDLHVLYGQVLAEICKKGITYSEQTASTDGEIVFRNIPWGSSADAFASAMTSNGISGSISDCDFDSWEWKIDHADVENVDSLDDVAFRYKSTNEILVAGFPVNKIEAYFHFSFDENAVYDTQNASSLYMAKYFFNIVDGEASYEVLKQKMIALYGECTEGSSSTGWWSTGGDYHEYVTWSVWYGANNTGVILWRNYEILDADGTMKSDNVYLCYGKSDSLSTMADLKAALAREQMESAIGDGNDGL